MNKYVFFAIIVIVSVFIDLSTKTLAENNLATPAADWIHSIEREVTADQNGMTVNEWVVDEFNYEADSEQALATQRFVYAIPEAEDVDPMRIPTSFTVESGDRLEVRYRQMEVLSVGAFHWDHVYVRNFGAAWGLFADKPESFRRPFFLGITALALVFVFVIYRGVAPTQKLLMTSLSFIVGGALGNFVDRVRYGYVVDFIEWYLVLDSGDKHWPTFNMADVFISVGVALMFIEVLFGKNIDEDEPVAAVEAEASVEAA